MTTAVKKGLDLAVEPRIKGLQEFKRFQGKELRAFRPALAGRDDQPLNIGVAGDSVLEGFGATVASKRALAVWNANMQNQYKIGGEGFIAARQGLAQTWAARFVFAGSTTQYDWGLGRKSIYLGGAVTDTMTSAAPILCDRFYVMYTSSPGTGTIAIVVDGVTVATKNTQDGQTVSGRIADSGPLPYGYHTIVIRPNAAANPGVIDGVMVFDHDENIGVHMWDGTHSGFMAQSFDGGTGEDAGGAAPAVGAGARTYWADYMFQPHTVLGGPFSMTTNGTTSVTVTAHGLDNNDAGEVVFSGTDQIANCPRGLRVVSVTDANTLVLSKACPTGTPSVRITRFRVTNATTTISSATVSGLTDLKPWDQGKSFYSPDFPAGTTIKRVVSVSTFEASKVATAGHVGTAEIRIKNRRKYYTKPDLWVQEFGLNEESLNQTKASYKTEQQAVWQTMMNTAQIDLPTMTGIYNDETPSTLLLGMYANSSVVDRQVFVDTVNGNAVANDSAGVANRFTQADVGKTLTGPYPGGTTILSVPAPAAGKYTATSYTASAPANAGGGQAPVIVLRQFVDAQWLDFRDAQMELCNTNNWFFLDLYTLIEYVGTDPQRLTYDGIHLQDRGQNWLADELTTRVAGSNTYGAQPRGLFNNLGEILVATGSDQTAPKPGIKRMAAQVVTAATANTMSDLTDLAFPLGPNETISFLINLLFTAAAATTGLVFDFNPSTNMSAPAALNMSIWAPASASTFTVLGRSDAAYGTDMVGTGSAGTVPTLMQIVGTITGGAYGGVLTPRAAPEIAAAVTVLRGSWALYL